MIGTLHLNTWLIYLGRNTHNIPLHITILCFVVIMDILQCIFILFPRMLSIKFPTLDMPVL